MNQQQVRQYLERYFNAHQTQYVEKTPSYFSVRLPVEVDKDLGNRPFYWTYVERLNLEPQPMFMTFVFQPESIPSDLRGEKITFGSPRLQQFFTSARRHGQYIRLYEHSPHIKNTILSGNTSLMPWLGINVRISMICDGKKDHLMSLGFNLVNGSIVEAFSTHLKEKDMKPVMPDLSFTIPPIFSLDSAMVKLEEHIKGFIRSQDTTWAEEARERLAFETSLVENFYTQQTEEKEEGPQENVKDKRVEELRWQFEPRIEVEIINGGLFYFLTAH